MNDLVEDYELVNCAIIALETLEFVRYDLPFPINESDMSMLHSFFTDEGCVPTMRSYLDRVDAQPSRKTLRGTPSEIRLLNDQTLAAGFPPGAWLYHISTVLGLVHSILVGISKGEG